MKAKLVKQRGTLPLSNRSRLLRIMSLALKLTGLDKEPGILQVILTETSTMAELNKSFLNHEGKTDVLTFDLRDENEHYTDEDCVAEVYVCPEVACEFAEKFGTTPSHELVLYIVHGMLHLSGEDDMDDEARKSMRSAESRVLSALSEVYSLEGFIP